jgi:glycosyltransferase involved in cell wall biosynthesis
MRVFPNLPIEPSGGERRTARICIATYEMLGPSKTGGIGTAYHSLATALTNARHQVTILYLWAGRSDEREMRYWQSQFRTLGITFVPLPASSAIARVPDCMQVACDAHAWLRAQAQFDVVHFPELHGHAYYCVLAKNQGIDFSHTILCIGTHSPISWIREQNKEAPYSPEELEMDFMERQSVALADVVVSPSQYMLRWMEDHGWTLPSACYVQQNIAPHQPIDGKNLAPMDRAVHRAAELVFFGRLEARKGLGLFCDALDHLQDRQLPGFSVAFLGKKGRIEGRDAVSYIKERAARWAFPYRTFTNYGRETALQFLAADPGRLAVIPSFEDNLPNTVMECLAGKLPFLATKAGGIPELIAYSDLAAVAFLPNAHELADRLAIAIKDGVPAARPAIDSDENRHRWIDWHTALTSSRDRDRKAEQLWSESAQPVVTVCLHHRGDYALLRQSLDSVRRQSYSRVEVLLSGYSQSGAEAELSHLTSDFESKGLRVVTRASSEAGTAPTAEARGEYVIFMEGSDYLAPDAVATFVKVASRTGADILTCFVALFTGTQEPAEQACLGHYPFLGKATLSGVFRNRFGRRFIFVKTDTLERLGSFPANVPRDCAEWQFLARAALSNCHMEVIAVPLGWYRISSESGPCSLIDYLDQVSAVAPYAQLMPCVLRDLPRVALTMGLQYQAVYERLADSPAYAVLQRLSEQRAGNGDSATADESVLLPILNRMPKRARKKILSLLEGWLEYSSARSRLPAHSLQRLSHIARQLIRGHYHRYAHGLGSALRDLRRPSNVGSQMEEN